MSTSGTQGSATTQEPWADAKEPMIDVINQATKYYGTNYQPYTGQKVADVSNGTQNAWDLTTQRATQGAPDLNAARGMAQSMASGNYLNKNPWLTDTYTNSVINDTAANMANSFATGTAANNDALFARSGAFGGSAHLGKQTADAAALANSVGQMANQYQLARTNAGVQDYQSGLGQMLQAGNLAGTLSQDDWTAANALKGIGTDQAAQQQKLLDSAYQDWSAQMQYPEYNLKSMANLLAQFSGYGTQNTTSPYATSGISNAIGGTTALAGLLSALKG